MGDPRPEGRDAVAVITALLPVYVAEEGMHAEAAWATESSPMLVSILRGKTRSELVTIVTHLGHIAAAMSVQSNPEDPYEVVRELAKGHQ